MEQPGRERGIDALRRALADLMADAIEGRFSSARLLPALAQPVPQHLPGRSPGASWLLTQAVDLPGTNLFGDGDYAASSAEDVDEGRRIIALVELARQGDKEAFGLLYDHYHAAVYRFLSFRVGSQILAEDLTSETFFRALRSMNSFRWQGKDFGAWLMTIARNLATDHFKAGRTRLEQTTEDMTKLDTSADGPENEVLSSLSSEVLIAALQELPNEQRECLVMRFFEGLSIAETADRLGRSAGAIKQLQLRGVRNLAKSIPEGAV